MAPLSSSPAHSAEIARIKYRENTTDFFFVRENFLVSIGWAQWVDKFDSILLIIFCVPEWGFFVMMKFAYFVPTQHLEETAVNFIPALWPFRKLYF